MDEPQKMLCIKSHTVCVCVCVCMYVYIYIYIYIHSFIHIKLKKQAKINYGVCSRGGGEYGYD